MKHCMHGFIDPARCLRCTYVPPKNPPKGELGHVFVDERTTDIAEEFMRQREHFKRRRKMQALAALSKGARWES